MVGKGGHFRSVLTATDIVDPPTRLLHVYRANFLDKKSSLSQGQIKRRANSSLAATCMMPASSRGRGPMPLIEVHLIEKVFSSAQKRQIIEKLTDAMVTVEGENMRGVTTVKISEVASGDWGIGGKPLTTEAVKELAAGRHAA